MVWTNMMGCQSDYSQQLNKEMLYGIYVNLCDFFNLSREYGTNRTSKAILKCISVLVYYKFMDKQQKKSKRIKEHKEHKELKEA